jgi:hypothetical protein
LAWSSGIIHGLWLALGALVTTVANVHALVTEGLILLLPKEPEKENVLVATAKTIGKAAGKIAALAGAKGGPESAQPQARTAKGRLPKANKARLPRRQKKNAQKKARRTA